MSDTSVSIDQSADFVRLPKLELNKVGDVAQHYISKVKEVHQKDPFTKIPKYWAPKYAGKTRPVGQNEIPAGKEHEYRPVMDIVLELDDAFSQYCTADLLKKLKAAAAEVGNSIDVGALVAIRLDELIPTQGQPRKIFSVKYAAPVSGVSL